ncbi:hypothetical protein [Mycolicibacterium stellerae]|uniref:hypothetical protein n=1 Tax=Mycolicibacterium stellerae TaxID=2358193 RepID=UPI000F0B8082|nr:hypothetical protein [Mycolicibacterium stellerae]
MISEDKFIERVIADYGPVIDLRQTPQAIIEIIRKFHDLAAIPDGGLPPGGVGPPTSIQGDEPTNAELMRKLLDIQRTVSKIQKGLGNGD